jgi:hypothetical protein
MPGNRAADRAFATAFLEQVDQFLRTNNPTD